MIKEIVKQWDERKHLLEQWFRESKQKEYDSYDKIVKAIFTYVVEGYDVDNIHKIDDGKYCGCQLFIIPEITYQPYIGDYIFTYADYGSCSGCDALISIYSDTSNKLPTEDQVKQYMMLALHLIQRAHKMIQNEDEEDVWYYPM